MTSLQNHNVAALFAPITIGSLTLPNRLVMAPMGRCFAENGVIAPGYAEYYRKRVAGGAGLIIGEASAIAPAASSNPTSPDFYGEQALAAWEEPVAAVHQAGGYFFPQIWHAGLARAPGTAPYEDLPSIGPSDWYIPNTDEDLNPQPGYSYGAPMSQSQIDTVIGQYGDAAEAAMRMGCDGVEIHGAHGYLPDQFLWPEMNRRDDAYNGASVRERARFAAEVVAEVRRRTRPDFPISFRFSQWKLQDYDARILASPDDVGQLVTTLADAGVDMFHVSVRRFWEPAFAGEDHTLAGWARKLSGKPVITVGSVTLDQAFGVGTKDYAAHFRQGQGQLLDHARPQGIEQVIALFEQGEFDMIAVGRAMIANPDWGRIVREGRLEDLRAYDRGLLAQLD